MERRGIVDAASDARNQLEFVYEAPKEFKSLFAFFKALKTRDVHLRCNPSGLTFFARDQSHTTRTVATVPGAKVNWYYCEAELWLGLSMERAESVFATIDLMFSKIVFEYTNEDPTVLKITFKDADLDKTCEYKLITSAFPPDLELFEAEAEMNPPAGLTSAFPIEFTLGATQFKKTVTDADRFSDTITVMKHSGHHLSLTYALADLVYTEEYASDRRIQLRADVPTGATFRATIKVSNVKTLAASMVADAVRVFCREDGDFLFRSAIDDRAIVVNTLIRSA